ncbi:thioviridamide family RiPP peptide [Streptomyces sp. S.PNR 29]|uniref:thioviridamide family RiPP peptide n=1 Tax=Streptomyces sp. S.PNR 29 TaxID=2973805 RepID=UPI0025B0C5A5|nr:thioviridamide family RiPP peptide [Streptomyces sp. S.PNR 29]MDN0195303.1 thioviridamide family RiPP peptide [Streptomyces sp. S.PNR 29]
MEKNEEDVVTASVSETDIENLVQQIKADDAANANLQDVDLSFAEISGLSEEELQQFLEEKASVTAASGVQQSVIGFAVTVAVHC